MSDTLQLTLDDIHQYVFRFGLFFFPAIDLAHEQVRAQNLYRTLSETWPTLFGKLSLSAHEFIILAQLQTQSGLVEMPTLGFGNGTPVIMLPLMLGGSRMIDLDDDACFAEAEKIGATIAAAFPGRRLFRLVVTREAVFSTGNLAPDPILVPLIDTFGGARLARGTVQLEFEDETFNTKLAMTPVRVKGREQGAGLAQDQLKGYAVATNLDVFNIHRRPMSAEDRAAVYERARALWPRTMLDYLNRRLAVPWQ